MFDYVMFGKLGDKEGLRTRKRLEELAMEISGRSNDEWGILCSIRR